MYKYYQQPIKVQVSRNRKNSVLNIYIYNIRIIYRKKKESLLLS